MKILYLSPNGFLGGAENVVLNLCLEHHKNKIDCKIIFFNDGQAVDKAHHLGLNCQVLKNKFKLSHPFKLVRALLEIREISNNYGATHLHGTMPYGYIVGFLSTIFMPIKRVWFQHGPVGNILDKMALHLPVDLILFNSHYLKTVHNQLFSLWSWQHQKKIVHLGVGGVEDKVTKNVPDLLKKDDEFICLLVGRVSPIKGQNIAIEALSHLRTYKNKVKLIIVGDMTSSLHRSYKQQLRDLVKKLNLDNQVIFVGEKSNVEDYYKAADLSLMTTIVPEAFGMVIAESMINQTLVLGNNQGGAADVLIDHETGFVYNSQLADSGVELSIKWDQVLGMIKNQPEAIEKIKNRAYEHISQNYSLAKFHQEVVQAYQDIN